MSKIPVRIASRARAVFLGGAIVVAASSMALVRLVHASDAPKAPQVALSVNESPLQRNGNFTTSFAPVVKQVAPSVVEVQVSTKSKVVPMPEQQFGGDEFMRRFFGQQFGNGN